MRNRAIFASNAPQAKRESGQRDGTHTEGPRPPPAGPEGPERSGTLTPVDTTTATTKEDESSTTKAPKLKYILNFAVFGLPKYRENTKASKKKFTFALFCPDCPKICHDGAGKGGGKPDEIEPRSLYGEHTKRGTPPHSGSGKSV